MANWTEHHDLVYAFVCVSFLADGEVDESEKEAMRGNVKVMLPNVSDNEYNAIEAEVIETSELINKELKNSNLPEEIRIGAVLRENKVIIPRSNFVFQKDDKVVFLAKKESISVVENIFRFSFSNFYCLFIFYFSYFFYFLKNLFFNFLNYFL